MFPLPFGETVTRLRGTIEVDRFSGEDTALDWSNPAELTILGCGFDPGDSTEPAQQGRDAVLTKPTVFAPLAVDVLAGDRLVVRGRTWQVDGDPAEYHSPFTGWGAGTAIRLKAMRG